MLASALYPIFLELQNCRALVVGFGSVGQRKARGLLKTNISVLTILDLLPPDTFCPAAQTLLADRRVIFLRRVCLPVDVRHATIVFAATSNPAANNEIANWCRQYGVLCNVATDPEAGNFIVPAVARGESMSVAVSTAGSSPLLAGEWRHELEGWLANREKLAAFMGRLRRLAGPFLHDSDASRQLYAAFLQNGFPEALDAGDFSECEKIGLGLLPAQLHGEFRSLLQEYTGVIV